MPNRPYTSFQGPRRIASGSLGANALAVKQASEAGAPGPCLTFDDATGRVVDLDLRGSPAEVLARLADHPALAWAAGDPNTQSPQGPDSALHGDALPPARGRGRPKLGVVAREVTLLPRHWDWLASQPGGASVSLRRLVDEARKAQALQDRQRQARDRTYRFMLALGGDLPGFEAASRALFAGDTAALAQHLAAWPPDLRQHALSLAIESDDSPPPNAESTSAPTHAMTSTAATQRALKQQYRETPSRAGVYAIRHLASGRLLVAGSANVEGALNRHLFELRQRSHRHAQLRADWAAQGEAGFHFEVLDRVKPRDDPGFSEADELATLVALWRRELLDQPGQQAYAGFELAAKP